MSNIIWNSTTSAYIGQPPNTERDYYIIRGFLRTIGLKNVDPMEGYTRAASAPYEAYTYTPRTPGIIAGLSIILVAITFATGTRLVLRAYMSQMRFGSDDWATIVAAAMGLTYTTCQIIMATRGGGHHIWDATYEDYNVFNYYGVLDKTIYYVTVGFVKVSLTLFIRRLASQSSAKWRWFCDIFLFTLAVYILTAIFWVSFTCNPPRAQWDKLYSGQLATEATCLKTSVQGKLLSITHVAQDVILLLSPMIILWKVQMDGAKKMRLFGMWGVGLIAVLCGLMRYLRTDFTSDVMWDYAELLVWTSLDVCIGIITVSLPVMDAWIAGAWRTAVTKIGRGYAHGTDGSHSHDYAHGTTVKSTVSSSGRQKYTDSVEQIIKKNSNNSTELSNIVRTDEYNITYEREISYDNESNVEGSDGQKPYNTNRESFYHAK